MVPLGKKQKDEKGISRELLTFFFPDILKSKCEAGIFPLHDANFSKCTFSNDSKKAKMVEIDYPKEKVSTETKVKYGN